MGFYLTVPIAKHNYRYHIEQVGDYYKITGRNKSIIISRDGNVIQGEIPSHYLQIIHQTLNEYLLQHIPQTRTKKGKESTMGQRSRSNK